MNTNIRMSGRDGILVVEMYVLIHFVDILTLLTYETLTYEYKYTNVGARWHISS